MLGEDTAIAGRVRAGDEEFGREGECKMGNEK